jgi:hypothetical protein
MITDWQATFALKEAIIEEDCEIRRAVGAEDQIGLVRAIRHWWAGFGNIGTQDHGESRDFSATGLVKRHRDKTFAGQCSGLANALAKIYAVFGFPACEYGVYVPETDGGLSHATTLVSVVYNGRNLVLAQDSLGDCEFRIDGADVSDFREILHHVAGGRTVYCFSPWPPAVRSRVGGDPPMELGKEPAFDLTRWLFDQSHEPELAEMARRLGRPVMSPADLMMFHQYCIHTIFGDEISESIGLARSLAGQL